MQLLRRRPTIGAPPSSAQRALDITVSFVLLLLLFPLLALLAVAVKLSSPGPILYRQARIGQGGRPFQLFKFLSTSFRSSGMYCEVR